MQVRHLLAAALLAATTVGAFAQEIDRDTSTFVSARSRAAVAAEAQNLRAAGQVSPAGERNEAVAVAPAAPAPTLTRAQVRHELAAARAAHQLPRSGELM